MCCCGGREKSSSTEESGGCCGGCCGGCGGCKCCGATEASTNPNWKQKKETLKDYKFKDVDLSKFRIMTIANVRKYITMVTVSLQYFLNYGVDIHIAYTLLTVDRDLYPKAFPSGIAYAVFAGMGTAILAYSIYRAVQVIQSDDISDAFIQHEAYRFKSILSYDVFCFFNLVTSKRSTKDKVVLFVKDTLYQLPQIISVKIPEFILIMNNIDALKMFASQNSNSGIPGSQWSANMKFSVLLLELAGRMFAVFILFPWVKCCMVKQDINEYADYLIESRINDLVEKGGAVAVTEESRLKPTD